jgi:mannose-1-phosphate guanylyltransferase
MQYSSLKSGVRQLTPPHGEDPACHRWGLILAGGDGTRLLPLTRKITGDDRPKQFCAVLGNETLLDQTVRRVSPLLPSSRTLLILTEIHRQFYADRIADLPTSSVVIQPLNRGTAPAILYSLMRIREMDPAGVVAFFPSDHYFSNDAAFVREIDLGYEIAELQPGAVILLGIPPEAPEVNYGWIEPGAPIGCRQPKSVFSVSRFWEKPPRELASRLMSQGCLWNTFVMVGRVRVFLNLIRRTLPGLVQSFEAIRRSLFRASEAEAVRNLYSTIRTTGFSQEVLQKRPGELAVLRASGLGWSDLGEPSRVLSTLERMKVAGTAGDGVAKELALTASASVR